MEEFVYSVEKNELIQNTHGISFESIILAIRKKKILTKMPHPNKRKYPNQKLMIIECKGYAYVVPYVEEKTGGIFLKTAFPSRKYTKQYIKQKGGKV